MPMRIRHQVTRHLAGQTKDLSEHSAPRPHTPEALLQARVTAKKIRSALRLIDPLRLAVVR